MEQIATLRLDELLAPMRQAVGQALNTVTSPAEGCPPRLSDAMRYSVLASGKRIRPVLTLLACEAVSGAWQAALPAACAVELVHAYSLIHDDLPCMDDDQLRRGKPTCHIQFDEATACLAGDSLQMLAIETICEQLPRELAVRCCQILSRASGRCQLVGGQMDDLAAEGRFGGFFEQTFGAVEAEVDNYRKLEFLKQIHLRKTSALIEASLLMGGVIGGADAKTLNGLAIYGRSIGLAFQIIDDCLDEESSIEQLGKTPRKDARQGKMTYPGLIGLEASKQLAEGLVEQACSALSLLGESATKLIMMAHFVVDRKS